MWCSNSKGRNAATVVQVDVLFQTIQWFGMLNMRCGEVIMS